MAEGLEIIEVTGRRMLDSEGLPAVEAEVELENGARGRAMVALCEDSEDTDRVMRYCRNAYCLRTRQTREALTSCWRRALLPAESGNAAVS